MTRRSQRDGNRASIVIAFLLAGALSLVGATTAVAQGQGDDAEIDVEWHDDGMGFDVTSTKDISNIWVEYCPGDKHKHDNLNSKEYTHEENKEISRIWVKSGNNGQPDNQPPGAGEEFVNQNADCDPGGDECMGPDDLEAEAIGTTIRLNWTSVDDAEHYEVYRSHEGEAFERVENTTDTEFVDSDVEPGETYTYFVTATIDGMETDWCEEVEVTAIPSFPTMFATAAAVVGGLGVYGTYRYRSEG